LFHWQGVLGGVVAELIAGMFTASRYKRAQGKIARQATFAALAAVVGVGAWRLSEYSASDASDVMGSYVTPLIVLVVGLWVSFRIVNVPRFADFLISVEAEMNKVSWPSRSELFRASLVVIVVIFFLAATLFMYDVVLKWLLGNVMGLSA
jgi:preprotein translocase subunit SecE